MESPTSCYFNPFPTLILGNSCVIVVILRVVVQAHTREGACFPRYWLGFSADTHINSFSFHNSMRCYSEDMEKGVNYPKSQVVVVEPVFRQRQSDSRTLRPAVFFVQFYSSGNKVKPFCSFCCSKGKPHICPLTYACIEFFFKLG